MVLSENGLHFLKKEEGVKLSSYLCPAGKWTIGTGFTFYPDGTPVKEGDKIYMRENDEMLLQIVKKFEDNLNKVLKVKLNQNQFDALISLSFNIGIYGFNNSTVLREVNKKPDNPNIEYFIKAWKFATIQGIKKPILLGRRERESNLYFKK